MTHVVVVGGGISGLAAARLLVKRGLQVSVLEAGTRWGGKLAPVWLDGVRLDGGAESLLARRPEAVDLAVDLGLADRLVYPTQAKPGLLLDGVVHRLPPSLQGVPTDLPPLRDLLTPAGFAEAAAEPGRAAPAWVGDRSIGGYVDERFGSEVTDRLLEPLLGGVYAGRSRELSFEAAAPELFARARGGGSLLEHAHAAVHPGAGPVFAGLVGGVSTLVDALVDDLRRRGVTLRLGCTVRELSESASGYALMCGPIPAPETTDADAVLLATPAAAMGRLLRPVLASAGAFAAIPYASMAVVTLVVHRLTADGSGVLVPPGELPTIKALTYSSAKWAWVAEQARRRWGEDIMVVRASVGRWGEADLLQLDDSSLQARTFAEARTVPGWGAARLVTGRVTRWGGGLPQYLLDHRRLVDGLRDDLDHHPRLAIAGAALDGVGIAACLRSAAMAASKIVAGPRPSGVE
jgi:oxygen-dependent protoporphyrinogen oxidase